MKTTARVYPLTLTPMNTTCEPWFTCPQCGHEGFCDEFFGDAPGHPSCLRCNTPYPGLTKLDYPVPTYDLHDFGLRELRLASELLAAHHDLSRDTALLGASVQVGFNQITGHVFLEDEEHRVAMMRGEELEEWHTCHECDHEGFAEDFFSKAPGYRCDRCGVSYLGTLA
jgi:hypothetical protein